MGWYLLQPSHEAAQVKGQFRKEAESPSLEGPADQRNWGGKDDALKDHCRWWYPLS